MLRHTKGLFGLSIVLMMVFLLGGNTAMGQSGTTSVHGIVTDQNGASVPNATITLTSAAIGVTLTSQTDKDGAYQFLEVRPATYTLTAEAAGFASYKETNLQLLVATPATVNIKMQLASVATTVEVISTTQTINTTDATIGNAFNQTQISALPFEEGGLTAQGTNRSDRLDPHRSLVPLCKVADKVLRNRPAPMRIRMRIR